MNAVEFEQIGKASRPLICFCNGPCRFGKGFGMCKPSPGGKCYTSKLQSGSADEEVTIFNYGCLLPGESVERLCHDSEEVFATKKDAIKCCDEEMFCNAPRKMSLGAPDVDSDANFPNVVLLGLLVFLALSIVLFFVGGKGTKKIRKVSKNLRHNSIRSKLIQSTPLSLSQIRRFRRNSVNRLLGNTTRSVLDIKEIENMTEIV